MIVVCSILCGGGGEKQWKCGFGGGGRQWKCGGADGGETMEM